MGSLAVPLQIIGTVVSTIGSYKQAQAEKDALKYQAAVNENNAILQESLAERNFLLTEDARKRGETEEYMHRLRVRALAGQQKASLAAAGVDVGFGSSIDLIGDTFELGELDALTIRGNAEREAGQYEIAGTGNLQQANNFRASAGLNRAQASQISPFFEAGSTLLSGATATATQAARLGINDPFSRNTTRLSNGETIYWRN